MRHVAGRQRCSETWPSCKSTWRLLWLQPDGRGRRQCVVKSRRRKGAQGSAGVEEFVVQPGNNNSHFMAHYFVAFVSTAFRRFQYEGFPAHECEWVYQCACVCECVCVSPTRALHFCLACLTFNNKTWHLFNAYLWKLPRHFCLARNNMVLPS